LKEDIFVPISPTDDHEQHLIVMWDVINSDAFEAHKFAHLQELIKLGENKQLPQTKEQQEWEKQENAMMNSAMSMWMAQAGSELSK
jgi:hypothetical protein